jgi:peroxiredoxin
MKNIFIFATIISLAGASGFALQRHLSDDTSNNISTQVSHTIRPDFSMMDLDGKLRDIKEWDGKIVLLNFWATWCAPCMKEIPDLIELQNRYGQQGLQVIGIAVDNEEAVREFTEKSGINYPVMASEMAGELSSLYGNQIGGLPFTAVINRNGEITGTITGVLDIPKAEEILSALGIDA